jgi:hypothetical protein
MPNLKSIKILSLRFTDKMCFNPHFITMDQCGPGTFLKF